MKTQITILESVEQKSELYIEEVEQDIRNGGFYGFFFGRVENMHKEEFACRICINDDKLCLNISNRDGNFIPFNIKTIKKVMEIHYYKIYKFDDINELNNFINKYQ